MLVLRLKLPEPPCEDCVMSLKKYVFLSGKAVPLLRSTRYTSLYQMEELGGRGQRAKGSLLVQQLSEWCKESQTSVAPHQQTGSCLKMFAFLHP